MTCHLGVRVGTRVEFAECKSVSKHMELFMGKKGTLERGRGRGGGEKEWVEEGKRRI